MAYEGRDRRIEVKADNIIWYLMCTFLGIIILGGSAWATSINSKVDKIVNLEVNIKYIQQDLESIKQTIEYYVKKRGE